MASKLPSRSCFVIQRVAHDDGIGHDAAAFRGLGGRKHAGRGGAVEAPDFAGPGAWADGSGSGSCVRSEGRPVERAAIFSRHRSRASRPQPEAGRVSTDGSRPAKAGKQFRVGKYRLRPWFRRGSHRRLAVRPPTGSAPSVQFFLVQKLCRLVSLPADVMANTVPQLLAPPCEAVP